MRKIAFLIIVITSFQIHSQTFEFGPHVLMSSSFIATDLEYDEQTSGSGIQVGLFGRLLTDKRLYFQAEINYDSKSATVSNIDETQVTDYNLKLRAIDSNILLGFKITDFDFGRFHLFAGPGLSSIIKDEVNINGTEYSKADIVKRSWDIHAGLGLDISILSFALRYQRTLTDLNNNPDHSLRLNTVLIGVGIKLL
ncbi:porin family protein [Mangrovivirga sp. M17]|uniref:Porin family protein n=1 Tax=Mangrovivirga halotolerans TaxID=2993936 RepID=A0ABT3RQ60_9BACT|nr:porin family protein [Mangrovivirga halotolerans]MCX2743933.1 porin family protein [Mangrovivirga halotolerans]